MTDTTATLSDKQLADNVRAAALALGEAWNAAADAGLTVNVDFVRSGLVARKQPNVYPTVNVSRVISEVL